MPDLSEDHVLPPASADRGRGDVLLHDFEQEGLPEVWEAKVVEYAMVPDTFEGTRSIRLKTTKRFDYKEVGFIMFELPVSDLREFDSLNLVVRGDNSYGNFVVGLIGERRYHHIVKSPLHRDRWQRVKIDLGTFFAPEETTVVLKKPVTEEMRLLEINLELDREEPGSTLTYFIDQVYLAR